MKKNVIITILLLILIPTITLAGTYVREKGEWSEWWGIGYFMKIEPSVKRIYDKENKLVCWIFYTGGSNAVGGIDCEPSLELGHPLLTK